MVDNLGLGGSPISLRADAEDAATECSEHGVAGAVGMIGVVDAGSEVGSEGVNDGVGDTHGDPSSSCWPGALWPLSSDILVKSIHVPFKKWKEMDGGYSKQVSEYTYKIIKNKIKQNI